ncbi:hypothetical protein [Rubrivirga sp.]|uniref:hypothetical protein n=1 Tax=Rubrivirga sp. TaxID=1885344 RepID=UPI003B526278
MTPTTPARLAALLVLALAGSAQAQISVRSALSDDREVSAGTVYRGEVTVANETATAQQAKVYLRDYSFQADGTNVYGEPGTSARSNAAWVRFGPAVVTLAPGETRAVQYAVTVPADAPAGSSWSLLMVESVPPDAPESTLGDAPAAPRYGVRPVMRYGVQLATHVRGDAPVEVTFSGAELVRDEAGARGLRVDVANTGGRMVRPEVWAELFDAAGTSHGRVEGARSRIYPGTSVRQRIRLGDLPPGTYRALVVVDAGADDVYGAEYVLDL